MVKKTTGTSCGLEISLLGFDMEVIIYKV